MTATTVRSALARKDARDATSARCPSEYTIPRIFIVHGGETVRCTRPQSGHRVHENGSFQWTKGNRA